jgi:hypothetical protein
MFTRIKLFIAGAFLLGGLSANAQVGDVSLSAGLFINSYTFTEATSLFSVGGTGWAKFNLDERLQIGAQLGLYVGSSTAVFGFGLDLVETRATDIPVLATLTYKVGNPDSWHAYVGAQAGGYYEVVSLTLLGEEILRTEEFYPAVGLLVGAEIPVTDVLFIQVRTGVDFLFIPEETIDEVVFEAEAAVVFPVALGLGLKF